MTDAELDIVSRLIDLCRAKGVRSIDVGGCKLELEPLQVKPEPQKPSIDADVCKCGHPEFAHPNGLCIHGCTESECVPNAEAK